MKLFLSVLLSCLLLLVFIPLRSYANETEESIIAEGDNSLAVDSTDGTVNSPDETMTYNTVTTASALDMVFDYPGLEDWINNNSDGTVTLGADIVVTYGHLYSYSDSWLNIDTGEYGFIIKGSLNIGDNVSITGNGAPGPVIRVCDGGRLTMSVNGQITAVGTDGVALDLEKGSTYQSYMDSRPVIRAEGAGSIAIKSEIMLDLDKHDIFATGTGARGMVCTEPVRLYLSRIEANGSAVASPDITLDTCIASPSVSGANIISRKITSYTPSSFDTEIGEITADFFDDFGLRCNITLGAEDAVDATETVFIELDASQVDFNTPGEYWLPGVLMPPDDYLYAYDVFSEDYHIGIKLDLYDPAIPYCIWLDKLGNDDTDSGLVICYYYTGDHDALTLWRSDDEGKSWEIYWKHGFEDSDNFYVLSSSYTLILVFPNQTELSGPVWFAFEVGDGIGSSVLYVDYEAIIKSIGLGGDRDGGDRITLPWAFFTDKRENNIVDDDNGGADNPDPSDPENKEKEDDTESGEDERTKAGNNRGSVYADSGGSGVLKISQIGNAEVSNIRVTSESKNVNPFNPFIEQIILRYLLLEPIPLDKVIIPDAENSVPPILPAQSVKEEDIVLVDTQSTQINASAPAEAINGNIPVPEIPVEPLDITKAADADSFQSASISAKPKVELASEQAAESFPFIPITAVVVGLCGGGSLTYAFLKKRSGRLQ